MILYHVRTGSYLPRCKKLFDCRCKAKDHVREILNMRDPSLKKDEIRSSIAITLIDTEKLPEYESLFKESELRPAIVEKSID